jgi:hypothetical protein
VAALEAVVYTGGVDDSNDSMAVALNLLMTAPLAARERHLRLVAVTVTVSTLYLLASQLQPTLAGFAGVAWMLYLVAGRAPRWVSAGLGLLFLLNGLAPFGGDEMGLESAILLVVAVAALAHRARAARRGRPPHLDDCRRGRHRAAGHARDARGR